MKNIITKIIGLAALAVTLGLNLNHAAKNYGITENSLAIHVMVQASNSGESDSSGGLFNPWFWQHAWTSNTCVAKVTESRSWGTPFYGGSFSVESELPGHKYICEDGWSLVSCSPICKPDNK